MTQKTILITGSSTGIGYDAAVTLRARGWRVFASCRKAEDCARLQGEGFDSPLIDYEDPETIKTAVAEVSAATGGRLDVLYNNGAYGIPGLVEDLPREAFRTILEANLIGPHDLTRQVIPLMRAQGHGRILNCTSVLGYIGLPWRGAYVATKFGLEGLTDTLRMEQHDQGIKVILIQPGLIDTPFGANAALQFDKWIDWRGSARADAYRQGYFKRGDRTKVKKPEAPASWVTKKIIHAVESPRPRNRYRVTKLAKLVYILKRLLPSRVTDWIIRKAA